MEVLGKREARSLARSMEGRSTITEQEQTVRVEVSGYSYQRKIKKKIKENTGMCNLKHE